MLIKQVKTMHDTVEFGILCYVRPLMFFFFSPSTVPASQKERVTLLLGICTSMFVDSLFTIVRTWNKT